MSAAEFFLLLLTLMTALNVFGEKPAPEMPRTYVDSSYRHPSGTTISVRSGGDLQAALDAAKPGDTVVLEAGATFTGNFKLRAKEGSSWIYVESSAIGSMAPPGQRTSPAEAIHMPKIETSDSSPAIAVLPGAANYRLVGLEITPAAGAPRVYQLVNIDFVASQIEAYLHDLAQQAAPKLLKQDQFPHHITVDRCYIHGSDTQDVREGVVANGIAVAIIDSYISDIHDSTMDSQAILAYRTPGPIKIVNNLLSATTEDVMFGGAGGSNNPYVPSDIEIRRNHFFKPLSWATPGVTLPPHLRWSVKNNLEFKSGQRAIVAGNILENNWKSAQMGYSIVLTPRVASGSKTVVDDITIESNILTNVVSGFNTLEQDDGCRPPGCAWPGEEKRLKIDNNLILFMNPNSPGGTRNWGISINADLTDVLFQHNTTIPAAGTNCSALTQSVYFDLKPGSRWPLQQSSTHNVWILDNVLCRQPSGDNGGQGTTGLQSYMSDPAPLANRYWGNVMFVPSGDRTAAWPAHNHATTLPLTYVNPGNGDYQLLTPDWTDTTDRAISGIDWSKLQLAMSKP